MHALYVQRRLSSDCADAQTDMNLCWSHVLMDTFSLNIGVNVLMDEKYLHGYAHAYLNLRYVNLRLFFYFSIVVREHV